MTAMLQPRAVWSAPARTPYYWARGDDLVNVDSPTPVMSQDIGPTFFAGGQVLGSGDVLGDPGVDGAWTVNTPGVWEVELVWDAVFGNPPIYAGEQSVALFAKVNGATEAATRSLSLCRHDVYLADWRTQVFRYVYRFAAGDRFQVWCLPVGDARVGSRCIRFRLLEG